MFIVIRMSSGSYRHYYGAFDSEKNALAFVHAQPWFTYDGFVIEELESGE